MIFCSRFYAYISGTNEECENKFTAIQKTLPNDELKKNINKAAAKKSQVEEALQMENSVLKAENQSLKLKFTELEALNMQHINQINDLTKEMANKRETIKTLQSAISKIIYINIISELIFFIYRLY